MKWSVQGKGAHVPNDDERLRILQMVARGELTPQAGQLEIAMLKTKAQSVNPSEDEDMPSYIEVGEAGLNGWRPHSTYGETAAKPNFAPLMALLALPLLAVAGFITLGLAFVLALPTYFVVGFWNAAIVPGHPGWPVLGFWSSLAASVALVGLWTLLGWGRRLKLAVRFGGGAGR
jgi:hypothetical protein